MAEFARTGIEVVLFDATGTLFDVRGSVGGIYARIAGQYGVAAEPAALQREFARAFRERSASGSIIRGGPDLATVEREWWKDVVRLVFAGRMAGPALDRYFDDVFEAFRRADAWALFPDTLACLNRLRSSGYRLGVLSNFDSRLLDLLEELELSPFFETVTISWRAGAAKPDREIFLHAAGVMRAAPVRVAHVGDSLIDDYEGAKNAGLLPVLLDRKGTYSAREGTIRIASLQELPL